MADWYAATDGTAGGAGTLASPWDLATALADTTNIGGGDTLWVRGGTYYHPDRGGYTNGYFVSLQGAVGQYITVRPYNDEHVIIDGGLRFDSNPSHVIVRDLEILVSENLTLTRVTVNPGSDAYSDELNRPFGGVNMLTGTDLKIVNNVIHDNAQGISFGANVTGGSEAYGNIVYDNGWQGPDRNHGHGMYIQNGTLSEPATTWKHIRENILIDNWSMAYQAFGTLAGTDLLEIAGNASVKGPTSDAGAVVIGGDIPIKTIRVYGNIADRTIAIGVQGIIGTDAIVKDNIAIDGDIPVVSFTQVIKDNNLEWQTEWTSPRVNGIDIQIPTVPWVYLTPNRYDPYRANLVIMNWPETANADVDFSGFLSVGDTFRLMTPTDMWGTPAHTGTWQGTPLAIPVASAQYSIFIAFRGPPTGGTAGWQ